MQGLHYVIVPAAGIGARIGAAVPKQFLKIGQHTVLDYTLQALLSCVTIKHVVVILSPSHDLYKNQLDTKDERVSFITTGSDTRAKTVLNGLHYYSSFVRDEDWILVHDAARPCLQLADLERLFKELEQDPVGGILALPISDTIKQADGKERIDFTRDRKDLWASQTPQMFRYKLLKEALAQHHIDTTDEASSIEKLNLKPKLVQGSSTNIKITYPEDINIATYILKAQGRYE
ncbi:2-C-methyl-D-erythritol 4-phosphate cytidylyltransferase [Ferrovum sp. PN-J185]|uniref:2-C-methyl-D-erythritol 4-phosphate cytidylyltransferase n=1 Tax=Ferrovum sp. PN-J185 TaxID=1356306 RepID=UPI000791EAB1|nr:2-C-methyl-D-erythritol 4-phosphate cytidylyltransferase [Ferrovum sp. PN-J185]KXW55719.1 2-C-methyl-D-erythritol 4-phosphate cytidylyltransferase [Ferrovum sp. PN-J185]